MKKTILLLVLVASFFIGRSQVENRSLTFDGTSGSKVVSGDINELDGTSQFSMEFWLYIDQWNEGGVIYNKQGANWKTRISMSLGPVATKRLYFHISDGANKYLAVENPAINVDSWHHLAVTYNGSNPAYQQMKVYVDGVEATQKWYSTGNGTLPSTTPSTDGDFEIGPNFNGKIDEIKVWSSELSSSELERKNTINKYHPLYNDLICYYRCDQSQLTDVYDYTDSYHGDAQGNVGKSVVTDNNTFYYDVVMAYVRENRFQRHDIISDEYLLNNNDILLLSAAPANDGSIIYGYPDNDGELTNTNYLSQHAGRNGVLDFSGSGAKVNCGRGLLLKGPDAGSDVFAFEAWVYIDNWVEGSCIMKKQGENWLNQVDIMLGSSASKRLYFHINNGSNTYAAVDNKITIGNWHHVAISYDGGAPAYNQVSITIDGISVSPWYSGGNGLVATSCTSTDGDFILGENFDGKMDEIRLWRMFRCPTDISNNMNQDIAQASWEYTMMSGYWKVDNSANPAKDLKNFKYDLQDLKDIFSNKAGANIRLGLTGGNFKEMIKTDAARKNFAHNVKEIVANYELDGVDLDFEWCTTTQEWSDYSLAITDLNDSLPVSSIFSVSLHPLYYHISSAAINALDMISIQFYGPSPVRYPYSQFVTDYNTVVNYGFPPAKLVLGLPFIGTTDNKRVHGYDAIVGEYPNLSADTDIVQMQVVDQYGSSNGNCVAGNPHTYVTKDMVFNGINTIIQKTQFVKDNSCMGVMYWDATTDVEYSSSKSLLRAMNTVINANVDSVVTSVTLKSAKLEVPMVEDQLNSVKLYPNPFSDNITIQAKEPIQLIKIFGMNGTKISEKKYDGKSKVHQVSAGGLSEGMYIIEVETLSKKYLTKITKK